MKILILILFTISNIFAQSLSIELLKKGDDYFKHRNYYKASKIYEQLINDNEIKNKAKILYKLGVSYLKLQKNEEAYKIFIRLINNYPDSKYKKDAIFKIVNYYKIRHKYREAINIMEKNLSYYLQDKKYKTSLLNLYIFAKKYERALSFLEKYFSENKWFIKKKVEILQSEKKYKEAILLIKNNITKYDDISLYKTLAELYDYTGDVENSALWYKKAYYKSNDITYLINEGRMYISHNLKDKAIAIWNKIFEKYGYNVYSYQLIGNLYKEFGLYNELIKLYNEAIQRGFDFRKNKIEILEVMGKIEEAVKEYVNMITDNNFTSIKNKILNIAFIEGYYDKVNNSLLALLNNHKKQLYIYPILIELYIKGNKIENGIYYIKKYTSLKNYNKEYFSNLISLMLQKNLLTESEKIFSFLYKKDKLSLTLKIKYLNILYLTHNFDKLLKVANTITSKKYKEELDYYKGIAYLEKKKYNKAKKYLEKHLNKYFFFKKYIDTLIYTKDYNKAYSLIEKNIENKSFKEDELLFQEAIILLFLKNKENAESNFNKIIKDYPDSIYANDVAFYLFISENLKKEEKEYFYKYITYFYLKNYKTSLKYLNQIKNSLPAIEYLKAKLYIKIKDYNNSILILKKLIKEKNYVTPFAMEELGNLYLILNNKDKATTIFKKLLNNYPSYNNVQYIREKLLNL